MDALLVDLRDTLFIKFAAKLAVCRCAAVKNLVGRFEV